jgi:outer membrane protein insertion porin family
MSAVPIDRRRPRRYSRGPAAWVRVPVWVCLALAGGAPGLFGPARVFAQQPRQFPELGRFWNEPEPEPPVVPVPVPAEVTPRAIDVNDDQPANPADLLGKPIADIRIEGNTTIPEAAILQIVRTQTGRAASSQQVREDVAKLLDTNWFFQVTPSFRASADGPVLVFTVRERPILQSVQFVGNKKIKTRTLESLTGLTKGHGFDPAANREAAIRIQQYYREKGYYFAKVTLTKGDDPDDRDVVFQIEEGKKVRVQRIRFQGNDFVSGPVLKTKVSTKTAILWLIGGDYQPETIHSDADALVKYYQGLGFFDAKVEPVEEFSDDKARVYVTFRIDEGVRFRVRSIEVIGNDVLQPSDLFNDQKLNEGDYFNERFLRADVTYMQEQYDNLGRLFAAVEPTPRFLEEPGWVDVIYRIDEDKPYYIGSINVNIRGDYPHSKEMLVRNQVNPWIQPGALARMQDIRAAQTIINGNKTWDRSQPATVDVKPVDGRDYLPPPLVARGQENASGIRILQYTAQPGFGHSIQAAVETPAGRAVPFPDNHAEEETGRARLDNGAGIPQITRPVRDPEPVEYFDLKPTYNIDPDAVFRSTQSDDMVFRGQSIDRHGIQQPYDPLQTISPQGDPYGSGVRNPATPGFVDVNVDVTEGRTGRLMFGVGVNSNAGVVGNIVLQEDNFNILRPPRSWADIVNGQAWRGDGQSFRLELVPGTQLSRYLVSWEDPYFCDTNYSVGTSGFFYNRFYNDWTEQRMGGRLNVGQLLSRHWSWGAALRLENVNISNFHTPAPALLTAAKGNSFLSTGQATLTYDTRDSAFLPTQGHMLEAIYEQGFGEFVYPRGTVQGVQYFTVHERPDGFGKHIIQFRGQLGWTGDNTPIYERFFAGGYSSFRGFNFRGVTPRQFGIGTGGQWMMLGTAEYLIPLTADDNIRAVVFSDFGTIENNVSVDHFRVTAGFGFRLAIPAMGPAPIALDFAWPIAQETSDDERIFSFYVGFTR